MIELLTQHLTIELCGALVGFSLALTGGGGSTLAIPLLLYVVGIGDMHLAIGTSALAVSVNAFANLIPHARVGQVHWRSGAWFVLVGIIGALIAAEIGKRMEANLLTLIFSGLMLVVAFFMLRKGRQNVDCHSNTATMPIKHLTLRLSSSGFGAGGIAGFFGVGGGFVIVPGLMLAARMTTAEAIGTSLLGVGCFGLATALSYASAGLVDWPLAVEFIISGIVGGWIGVALMQRINKKAGVLETIFATALIFIAIYMAFKTLH